MNSWVLIADGCSWVLMRAQVLMGAHGCSCVFMTSVHVFLFVCLFVFCCCHPFFQFKTVGSRKRSLSDGSALGWFFKSKSGV